MHPAAALRPSCRSAKTVDGGARRGLSGGAEIDEFEDAVAPTLMTNSATQPPGAPPPFLTLLRICTGLMR
jgi:hypothetical protein